MNARITMGAIALAALPVTLAFAQLGRSGSPVNLADPHAGHVLAAQQPGQAAAVSVSTNPNLPADDAGSKQRLSASSRHGEWIDVS